MGGRGRSTCHAYLVALGSTAFEMKPAGGVRPLVMNRPEYYTYRISHKTEDAPPYSDARSQPLSATDLKGDASSETEMEDSNSGPRGWHASVTPTRLV